MWTDYMYFVESIDAFNIKIHPSCFFRIHIHSSKRLGYPPWTMEIRLG